MEYGLIGERLPHSFSKEVHRRCADYPYELVELKAEQVGEFLEKRDFRAINVTIPYKQTVIPFLSETDAHARAIGAVNTVVNREGKLYGYNTDFYGMEALLRRAGICLAGKKVLILGTGGTCRTARSVALAAKAASVICVGRRGGEGCITYEEAYASHTDGDVIINTTPCGMFPYADGGEGRAAMPLDLSRFPRLCGVVDAVYNPLRTNLVLEAKARGIPAEGGLYMLVAQGVKASRIFLGRDVSDEAALDRRCEEIYGSILREKENIVLTGMPSCGKSTVGKALAEALGRPFADSDGEIVRRAGMSIPEIFAQKGETYFRDLESEVLTDLANTLQGGIIATGGGAVLRERNIRALKRTGRIYFLDRSLSLLLPTADRPLASDREAVRRRYEERYGRYRATCDCRIPADGEVAEAVRAIRKDFDL